MANIRLQPTHISTLDEILGGGIPQGSVVVLKGAPGSGKTILASNWLCAGQTTDNEPGLYIAATEPVERALTNMSAFNFFSDDLVGNGKLQFTDLTSIFHELELTHKPTLSEDEINQIIIVIRNMVDRLQVKRVVFDSITALLYMLESPGAVRNFIFKLGKTLSTLGATVVLISEGGDERISTVEDFIADGIIVMNTAMGGNSRIRKLEITKMRGTTYRSGPVIFDITADGIIIFPKIPTYHLTAKTEFKNRISSGIAELDVLMNGGYPQGHMILFGGNTGSGKSTFAAEFLFDGINKGEPVVMVALAESVTQIKKNAVARQWDFEKWEQSGLISFVTTDLVDINPDRLLYDIVHKVQEVGAKRVVIDSISSMESGTFDKYQVREFMLQIAAFFKSQGITCIMTYLTTDMFGSSVGQLLGGTSSNELRLSSIVDGIVLLRYVERDQKIKKLLNILKMRGSEHDKSIREFSINQHGIHIGEPFSG